MQDAEILKGETGEPEGDDPDLTLECPPRGIPLDHVLGQEDKREGEEPNAASTTLLLEFLNQKELCEQDLPMIIGRQKVKAIRCDGEGFT